MTLAAYAVRRKTCERRDGPDDLIRVAGPAFGLLRHSRRQNETADGPGEIPVLVDVIGKEFDAVMNGVDGGPSRWPTSFVAAVGARQPHLVVGETDPPLLLTHEPLEKVPAGCVNVHGHLHGLAGAHDGPSHEPPPAPSTRVRRTRVGPGAGGLRFDGVDHVRAWRDAGVDDSLGPRSRGDRRVGRQRERP